MIFIQIPQDIPNQSTPIDLTSATDIILYIVLPIIMITAYIYWRRKKRSEWNVHNPVDKLLTTFWAIIL